jgi:hypothetical protein
VGDAGFEPASTGSKPVRISKLPQSPLSLRDVHPSSIRRVPWKEHGAQITVYPNGMFCVLPGDNDANYQG